MIRFAGQATKQAKMTILDRILAHKRVEVAQSMQRVTLEQLQAHIATTPWKARDFYGRLMTPDGPGGVNIIAEIKRASPSRGEICVDLRAGTCAAAYETGGAAAISVLTDSAYFKGSLVDLRKARRAVALPVLRKEFIISAYQVYESRVAGSDALLLIARILEPGQLRDLLGLTHELGMAALVEIHNREDYAAAHQAGAKLIAINNRDLATFDTEIDTAMSLANLLQPEQVPVAASGIGGREDIERNLAKGIFTFLIGESIVRSRDRAAMLKHLIHGTPEN